MADKFDEQAMQIVVDWYDEPGVDLSSLQNTIAAELRAVAAAARAEERERAAKIADEKAGSSDDDYGAGWSSACVSVAAAIRAQGEAK